MFFIKKDEIISTDDFIIRKGEHESPNEFWIFIYWIQNNQNRILAKCSSKEEQEQLYNDIINAIRSNSKWYQL